MSRLAIRSRTSRVSAHAWIPPRYGEAYEPASARPCAAAASPRTSRSATAATGTRASRTPLARCAVHGGGARRVARLPAHTRARDPPARRSAQRLARSAAVALRRADPALARRRPAEDVRAGRPAAGEPERADAHHRPARGAGARRPRARPDDARGLNAALTAAGRAKLSGAAGAQTVNVRAAFLGALTPAEQASLAAGWRAIADRLDADEPPPVRAAVAQGLRRRRRVA